MNTKNQDTKIMVQKITEFMQDKKVKDIVILDVGGLTSLNQQIATTLRSTMLAKLQNLK